MDQASYLRAIAALFIVLGLLGLLWWGMRRFTNLVPGADSHADLKIIAWRLLDGRRKLAVIRWGDQEHLILTGPGGDTAIAQREAKSPASEQEDKET